MRRKHWTLMMGFWTVVLVIGLAVSPPVQAKDKTALTNELKEQKETMDVRVKTLDRQDKHLRERHQSLQEQITKALQIPSSKGEDDEDEPKAG